MDGSKLQAIPRPLRSEPSPRIQDSAFPPFKVEHRYRGVYERAGFDVYKGDGTGRHRGTRSGNSTPRTGTESTFSGNNSNHSVTSPHNQTFSGAAQHERYERHNRNEGGFGSGEEHSRASQIYSNGRNKSHGDLYTKPSGTVAPSSYSLRNQSVPNTAIGTTFDHSRYEKEAFDYNRNYSGATVVPSINESAPDATTLNMDKSLNNSTSSFNFSPATNSSKNYMGLSLDLNNKTDQNDPIDRAPLTDDTIDGNDTNGSNKFDSYDNDQNFTSATSLRTSNDLGQAMSVQTDELLDTPERTRQRAIQTQNGLPTPPATGSQEMDMSHIRKQRLSTALDGFKNDYTPNNQFSDPFSNQSQPQFQVDEPRLSYAANTQNGSYDPSSQFESFKKVNDDGSKNLNVDYQNFLNGNPNPNARQSHLSMVSSIISKESRYSEDDDAEVQQELERQLESIKNGGSSELLSTIPKEEGIEEMEETEHTFQPSEQTIEPFEELGQPVEDPEQMGTSETKAAPVSDSPYPKNFPEENIDEIDTPETPSIPTFNIAPSSPGSRDSIESIKPLSVRHSKSKNSFELPDISKTPKAPVQDAFNDEVPVLDEVTSDLQEVKLERKIVPAFKYPSGSGPCRSCDQKISPIGKGPKKAVYSKTGELTGQWHRECFRCASDECTVKFSKSVQCYVLDDEAYCSHHYHTLNNTVCEFCRVGIEGECIENELEQKWHLHCLRCLKCNNVIGSDYYLINDGIYCDHDAINIISGQDVYNDGNGNSRSGLTTNDKVEKRRTRLMHIDHEY